MSITVLDHVAAPPHAAARSTWGRTLPWLGVAAWVLAVATCVLAGAGGALRVVYPIASFGVAALLYGSRPTLYPGFALWCWFVTPFVRRVADYSAGWQPQSPLLLVPLAVSAISLLSITRRSRRMNQYAVAPFVLVFVGLLYGFTVGVLHAGAVAATYAFALWAVPPTFGLALALWPEWSSETSTAVERTLLSAAGVLGTYGIWQFLTLPSWDRVWMLNARMGSIGSPVPRGFRVFSTLNSQGPFAVVLMCALLLLLSSRLKEKWFVAVPGFLALLLTLVRAAWLGWGVGVVCELLFAPVRSKSRTIVVALVLAVAIIPAVQLDLFNDVIVRRASTLQSVEHDASYRERASFHDVIGTAIANNPIGEGLGATGSATVLRSDGGGMHDFDSGLLDVVFSLGWFGGLLYLAGVIALVFRRAPRGVTPPDRFGSRARAISIAVLSLSVAGNAWSGITGVLLWTFVGLGIAADHRRSPAPYGAG